MEYGLLFLFIISFVYCCDIPALQGLEFLVNDHNSLLYAIGVSIVASYFFYLFQVVIPRIIRFRSTRSIAVDRLYKIEDTMCKMLCCLQGEPPNPGVQFSKDSIERRLNELGNTGVFDTNSACEIHNHKELSIFEALVYYDGKIMELTDEIITCQYLETKHENTLLCVKELILHKKLDFWLYRQPGEYKRRNQESPGYMAVSMESVNSDIVSCVDECIQLYEHIKKIRKQQYQKLHTPFMNF